MRHAGCILFLKYTMVKDTQPEQARGGGSGIPPGDRLIPAWTANIDSASARERS